MLLLSFLIPYSEAFPVSPSLPNASPTRSSDLFRFGLSNSCCNIAQQLLQDNSSTSNDSEGTITSITLGNEDTISEANTSSSPSRQKSGSICMTKQGTEKLEQFIQKIVDSKICRVCMDNPISAVFCPCGHYMTCYQCARECKKCPMCRKQVAYVQYVYGSAS